MSSSKNYYSVYRTSKGEYETPWDRILACEKALLDDLKRDMNYDEMVIVAMEEDSSVSVYGACPSCM